MISIYTLPLRRSNWTMFAFLHFNTHIAIETIKLDYLCIFATSQQHTLRHMHTNWETMVFFSEYVSI